MILLSFGLPGHFADWCDAVVIRLAERALGEVALVSANTPEQLASGVVTAGCPHTVVSSRQPGHWLRRLLVETEKRFVLAVDDPRLALANLVAAQQLDWVRGARIVACACASLTQCLAISGGLVLQGHQDSMDPYKTATTIAHHLGLAVPARDIETVIDDLAANGVVAGWQGGSDGLSNVAEASLAAINGALSAYVDQFLGKPLGQIIWARDLFLTDHQQPATHAIEVTGRSRYLIYGPYIAIPPGQWTADVLLGFSQETTETNFIVDVFAGSQLTSASIRPPKEGVFPVTLNFELVETNDSLLEIRVMNERAVFDGKIALMLVTLSSQHRIPIAVLEAWVRDLGLLTQSPID